MNRNGYARDIADADGRRKRGGQCLEVRNVARLVGIVVLAGGHGKPVSQSAQLNEPETQREEEAGSQQRDHHIRDDFALDRDPDFPNDRVQLIDNTLEQFHESPEVRLRKFTR